MTMQAANLPMSGVPSQQRVSRPVSGDRAQLGLGALGAEWHEWISRSMDRVEWRIVSHASYYLSLLIGQVGVLGM